MHEDYHALALLTSLLHGFNYFSYTNQSLAKREDGIRLFSILVFDGESFQLRGKDEKVGTIGFAGNKLAIVYVGIVLSPVSSCSFFAARISFQIIFHLSFTFRIRHEKSFLKALSAILSASSSPLDQANPISFSLLIRRSVMVLCQPSLCIAY